MHDYSARPDLLKDRVILVTGAGRGIENLHVAVDQRAVAVARSKVGRRRSVAKAQDAAGADAIAQHCAPARRARP